METLRYANPNCRHCKGRGKVRTGPGLGDFAICVCAEAGRRREAAQKLVEASFPERAREMTLSSFDTGGKPQNELALQVARNFVDNFQRARQEGWVLGFWGQPRAGKTHLAVATAQACTKRYMIRPMLLNLPKALRMERERFDDKSKPSPFSQAQAADLLVIDDLGAEYERMAGDSSRVSWLSEMVYMLIDERIMQNKPFIYTTNLSPADIENRYSGETWHRVLARLREAEVNPAGALEVIAVPGKARSRNAGAAEILFAQPKGATAASAS
jgi:DNA replication protein DnaC